MNQRKGTFFESDVWRKDRILRWFVAGVIFLGGYGLGHYAGTAEQRLPIVTLPVCPEDDVLVGSGDYNGREWTAYSCGPARRR